MPIALLSSYRGLLTKEKPMNKLVVGLIGGALLLGGSSLMIARAQQKPGPVLIAGDRPVTAEQIEAKLKAEGWSNIVISPEGRYVQVTGLLNGKAGKIAVDSQTGRLRASDDDDDDD
jgi:hypothetical protein